MCHDVSRLSGGFGNVLICYKFILLPVFLCLPASAVSYNTYLYKKEKIRLSEGGKKLKLLLREICSSVVVGQNNVLAVALKATSFSLDGSNLHIFIQAKNIVSSAG